MVGCLGYRQRAGQHNTRACLPQRQLEMDKMLSSGPSRQYLGSWADPWVKRGLVAICLRKHE